MLPAIAYATTSGGDARKFIFTCGWMRPSKLRLPDSTEHATTSLFEQRVRDLVRQRARVADARRAAVADEVEADRVEVLRAGRTRSK